MVVVLGLEAMHELVGSQTRGDSEGTQVVFAAAIDRRDEIRQRVERLLPLSLPLLPQRVKASDLAIAIVVRVDGNVVADRCRGPEAINAPRREQLFLHDTVKQPLGIVEELASGPSRRPGRRRSSDTFRATPKPGRTATNR